MRSAIPSVPAIEVDVKAKHDALSQELRSLKKQLGTAEDKILTLTVENSQLQFCVSEIEKQSRSDSDVRKTLKQTLTILREYATEEMLETMRDCGLLESKPAQPVRAGEQEFRLPLRIEYRMNGTDDIDGATKN